MSFLLLEIVTLLSASAICGGLFVYWWVRRDFREVTSDYHRLAEENEEWRRSGARLLGLDLSDRLESIDNGLRAISASSDPFRATEPDLSHVYERLDNLDLAVKGHVYARLDAVDQHVRSIRIPMVPDLSPIYARLDTVDAHVQQKTDVDLAPLGQRIGELERSVQEMRANIDLNPFVVQLSKVEAQLRRAEERNVEAQQHVRNGSRNLLEGPAFGKADDLKRIRGVADGLERLLNELGVYYYWQIAEWGAGDIAYVDAQLGEFRGCIERDTWVVQCRAFARERSSNRRPEHLTRLSS
jgi:predicted flap endonuclease-1-like 5' DNA nuclease